MLDLLRRSSKRMKLLAVLAVLGGVGGAAAALLGADRVALAILCLMLAVAAPVLVVENTAQHRERMQYAYKADHRLRALTSRLDNMTRTVDRKFTQMTDEVGRSHRRILASVESERYSAAARHHQIADAVGRPDDRD